ncbi:MAG TPA: nitrate reductase molybdenum cofactor assembly chaperone [Gammaproteobacteria bacterium]
MILYNILSRLLDYPDPDLKGNLDLIREALAGESELKAQERTVIERFVDEMQGEPLMQLQQEYVQTFDMVPEHSLHLTHHLFGDDRGRGPALVDLSEHYKGMGLEMKEGEIPDYLPLILEYVATLDEVAARLFLADAGKVLTVLAANLENAESRYAPLLRLVEHRGHLTQTAA